MSSPLSSSPPSSLCYPSLSTTTTTTTTTTTAPTPTSTPTPTTSTASPTTTVTPPSAPPSAPSPSAQPPPLPATLPATLPPSASSLATTPGFARLFTSTREREAHDKLAELFSIATTLERLEQMHVADAVADAAYDDACAKLCAKLRIAHKQLPAGVDVNAFVARYKLHCPAALDLLLRGNNHNHNHNHSHSNNGSPPATTTTTTASATTATTTTAAAAGDASVARASASAARTSTSTLPFDPASSSSSSSLSSSSSSSSSSLSSLSSLSSRSVARIVAETVHHFITLMDSLRLNMVAADQVLPLLNDLCTSIAKAPDSADGVLVVRRWLAVVTPMKASDELDEHQVRQMLYELDAAYTAFYNRLKD